METESANRFFITWLLLTITLSILIVLSYVTSQTALISGVLLSLVNPNPYKKTIAKFSRILIQTSIVCMGFKMNIFEVLKVSVDSFLITVLTIGLTLLLGYFLGKVLKIPHIITSLISVGTAICGGSAIAAVGSVISATESEISLSIACVFIFNALALFVLPTMGEIFTLSQSEFGKWAGISIHDISSVVGAASLYGSESLNIATTVKLSRTLWIIPMCLIFASLSRRNNDLPEKKKGSKLKIPIFIVLYVAASLYTSIGFPFIIQPEILSVFVKRAFAFALFLIGLNTSIFELKIVGFNSVLLAATLWISIAVFSFLLVIGIR